MQTGYVACPDCLSTLGWLGAEGSFSTVHFAAPVPVFVAVQPGGGAPVVRLSKFTVSASATLASIAVASIVTTVIGSLPCHYCFSGTRRRNVEPLPSWLSTSIEPRCISTIHF